MAKYEMGQVVGAAAARYEKKETTPPERFTEATLLDEMSAAWKYAKTPEDRAVLKSIGLGTSRTRLPMISGLISRQILNVEKKGKRSELVPSALAMALRDMLPPFVTDVAYTAKWEITFQMIAKGQVQWDVVVDRQHQFVEKAVELARQQKNKGVSGATAAAPGVAGKAAVARR